MQAPPRILVGIATYNERDNLSELVNSIRTSLPAAEVLILDDNSPDGTGALADELAARDAHLHVIHRAGKLGLGSAILTMMRHAIEGNYDFMINMDADFSHHPRYLPSLVKGMDDADVTIGSRYIPGGGVENWPWSRQFMSKSTNHLVRLLMGMPVRDASGGFRCYRVALLRRANLDNVISRGYSFQQEVLHRCHLAGARFAETPIVFADRRHGKSKAGLSEIVRSLSALFRLGWRARFHTAALMPRTDGAESTRPPARFVA
jgi:dolichol-phosphate mannosyltransferase